MLLALAAILCGLVLLVWSAGRFIDGAAATAVHAGLSSLLIGMVVVGFGTSAPELLVSATAAWQGRPELALGNAIGSNIANIGLILGLTALLAPLAVHRSVLRRELPLVLVAGMLAGLLLLDGALSRGDALTLLATFAGLMGWSIWSARGDGAPLPPGVRVAGGAMPLALALWWLFAGLVLLLVASRMLVWGAVTVATALGVSDLVIGLTIVAVGTSLPELASSLTAARRGEDDLAVGNIVGSNLFNLLAVIGLAGVIAPLHQVAPEVLIRDWTLMMGLTLALLVMAWRRGGEGRLTRVHGVLLLATFIAYTGYLVWTVTAGRVAG